MLGTQECAGKLQQMDWRCQELFKTQHFREMSEHLRHNLGSLVYLYIESFSLIISKLAFGNSTQTDALVSSMKPTAQATAQNHTGIENFHLDMVPFTCNPN